MAGDEADWNEQDDGSVFISHWTLRAADLTRLQNVTALTLWNVKLPVGFRFGDLPYLRWLDLRGGSAADLAVLGSAASLRGLAVNQIRGLADLTAIAALSELRILSLYGLAKVTSLPDLSGLTRLRRLELGQLRSLENWQPLVSAPALEELHLINKLTPDLAVIEALAAHPTLRGFAWYAPDEPRALQDAVRERLSLPTVRAQRPEQWLAENDAN